MTRTRRTIYRDLPPRSAQKPTQTFLAQGVKAEMPDISMDTRPHHSFVTFRHACENLHRVFMKYAGDVFGHSMLPPDHERISHKPCFDELITPKIRDNLASTFIQLRQNCGFQTLQLRLNSAFSKVSLRAQKTAFMIARSLMHQAFLPVIKITTRQFEPIF